MVAASRRGDARLMAAHCRRFNPNVALLHQLVARGQFGPLQTITAGLGGPYGNWPQRTDFRRHRAAGGGVLLDLGIHLIDLAVWLTGARATIAHYEATDTLGWGAENDAEVVLAFEGGTRAILSCSYTHGLSRTLRVEGADGWAHTSLDSAPMVTAFSRRSRLCTMAGAQHLLVDEVNPYQLQLDHFVESVRLSRPFAVSLGDVLNGLQVIERCYELERAA